MKKLVSFSSRYFLYGEMGRTFDSSYGISVEKDNGGKLILSEEGHKIKCETNEEYLEKVQEIIVKHNLMSINGLNRHTSGLPYQFQPCYFSALYDSGEELRFSVDNNPQSEWGRELLKITREEFDRNGITALDLPEEMKKIKRFSLSFTQGELCHQVSEIQVPKAGVVKSIMELAEEGYKEGEFETKIEYRIWNRSTNETKPSFRGEIKEEYYRGLEKVVKEVEIEEFASPSGAPIHFNYKDVEEYYEFYIEYEYGNVLNGFSDTPEMNSKFAPGARKIIQYIKMYLNIK